MSESASRVTRQDGLRATKRKAAGEYWQERRQLRASIATGRRLPRWEHEQYHRALNLRLTWSACRALLRSAA